MKVFERLLQTKTLGVLIVIFAIGMAFVSVPPTIQRAVADAAACTSTNGTPMTWYEHLPAEFFLSVSFVIIMGVIGTFLSLRSHDREKMDKAMVMKLNEVKKKLKGDEKTIYETVANNEGVIFQSELVEKVGFPKTKVSRILDKLEGKGLIERRRRGLSNIILIKYH
jgi:uncharacterized membrane protein